MVKRLINYESYVLPQKLVYRLKQYSYAFNPSFVKYKGNNYLAVRVYDDNQKKILALIFIWTNTDNFKLIDLSQYFYTKLDFKKVADPKLFVMDNKVYCTFNTGDGIDSNNKLVLLELYENEIKKYFCCDYEFRTKTEKNWAFYIENNQLFVFYSLSPLTILKAVKIGKDSILFDKYFFDDNQNFKNCSIGTPLLKIKGSYRFIAHKKYYRKRKRLYLGRLSTLTLKDKPSVNIKKGFVFHSFRSLFGDNHKFNKNLISCSYFSGLCEDREDIILSYGINDVNSNLVKINKNKLWH